MRRSLAILVSLLLCVAASACGAGGGEDAYAAYKEMGRQMEMVSSWQLSMHETLVMEGFEEPVSIKNSAEISYIRHSEDDVDLAIAMDMDAMDSDVDVYYTDGIAYMRFGEDKVQGEADPAELLWGTRVIALDFEEADIKASSVKNVDGGKRLTFTFGSTYADQAMEEPLATIGLLTMLATSSELVCEMEVDEEGYLKAVDIVYSGTADYEGDKDFVYNLSLVYSRRNGVVAIDFPTDLDTYQEL